MTCPNCGIDTAQDMDPVYCTFIPKGVGKMRLEAPMCAPCAAILRIFAQTGADLLEDRDPVEGARFTAPSTDAASVWAQLGIVPRER